MKGAVVILIIIAFIGLVLYISDRIIYGRKKNRLVEYDEIPQKRVEQSKNEEKCCGMHLVCDKTSSQIKANVEYYDDEDLDCYVGRSAASYSSEEIDDFREVLFSLFPSDIVGWTKSIQFRGIEFPESLRDELIMMIQESRKMKS